MVQITVYAGAIMVLFLFVIMLLGAEKGQEEVERPALATPVALVLGLVLLGEAVFVIFGAGQPALTPQCRATTGSLARPEDWRGAVYHLSAAVRDHVGPAAGRADRRGGADDQEPQRQGSVN